MTDPYSDAHAAALERAWHGVEQATQSVQNGRAGELVAVDLRIASDALGEITGAITTDEILERIFAEFCIGKGKGLIRERTL